VLVVGPSIATAVADLLGACTVLCHANEQQPIVTIGHLLPLTHEVFCDM